MAKTSAERVYEHRRRQAVRASYFDELNELRIRSLRLELKGETPEERAVREMCLNYPRVLVPPCTVSWGADALEIPGGYQGIEVIYYDDQRRPSALDMAAAYTALREILSARIFITYMTNDGCGAADDEEMERLRKDISADVSQLREAGLWFRK